MDQLQAALSALNLNLDHNRQLGRAVKTLLEGRTNVTTESIKQACQQYFDTTEHYDENTILVWQLVIKHNVDGQLKLANDMTNPYMVLGQERAKVLYEKISGKKVLELIMSLPSLYKSHANDRPLAVAILEVCEYILPQIKDDSYALGILTREILKEALWQQDELVLHKARTLTVSLFKVLERDGDLYKELAMVMTFINPETKTRYLLLKDLLEAGIVVDGFTNLADLKSLVTILIGNKGLAPVISDCIVLLLKFNFNLNYALDTLLPSCEDELCLLGTFLYPRLFKRLLNVVWKLISMFDEKEGVADDQSHDSILLDENKIKGYCFMLLAIVTGEGNRHHNVTVRMDILNKGLESFDEKIRQAAFSCLCRHGSIDTSFDQLLGQAVNSFVVDLMLNGTSDSRQQTVTALKQLIDTHFNRLYKLFKIGDDSKEMELIIQFWSDLANTCCQSLSAIGFYNKNDICLSILRGLLDTWNLKLDQCASEKLKRHLSIIFETRIVSSLCTEDFFNQLIECCGGNTFDSVRMGASNLLKSLTLSNWLVNFNKKDQWGSIIKSRVIPTLLADHRTHIVDGNARLVALFIEMYKDEELLEYFITLLKQQVSNLDPSRPETFVDNCSLSVMTLLRMITTGLSKEQSLLIAELCQKTCCLVLDFVSQPSPEGYNVTNKMGNNNIATIIEEEIDEDIEEDDEDGNKDDFSFSVMTFCWKATKASSTLLALSLKNSEMSEDKLCIYGKFLVDMMMKIRHPGAFMSLARPLKEVCQLCFNLSAAKHIPDELLDMALDVCIKLQAIKTTRRSAGLPVCITSIISACPDANHRMFMLKKVFIVSAEDEGLSVIEPDPFIVHSLNIFCKLFRESSLAEETVSFVPLAFNICSRALTSPSWAVRNSGMMLFTALMNRTFGVRHDADDYSLINLVDPRTVYAKYGTLFRSADNFADFAILQRLRYSSGGEQAHGEYYKEACDFAQSKLSSEKMKERKMSVRLLAHMCESVLLKERILDKLNNEISKVKEANLCHGMLLLIRTLEERKVLQNADYLISLIPKHFYNCYPIRVLFDNPVDNNNEPSNASITIEKAVEMVRSRRMSDEEATLLIRMLLESLDQNDYQMITESIYEMFESFWTDYDLEGTFRKALICNWKPLSLLTRPVIRIWYLALTDDDDEIRYAASIRFGQKASIPSLLRLILTQYHSDIKDLLPFMPIWNGRSFDKNRTALFEPEPLNDFKDPAWEKQFLPL